MKETRGEANLQSRDYPTYTLGVGRAALAKTVTT